MKTILFKPFEKYSDKTLLTAGIIITLVGSFLAYLMNAHYDGVLDLHFAKNVEWWQPFVENLVNLFCLVLFLFILAKYLNKQSRAIDILVAAMVSRWPHYLFSLSNINDYTLKTTEKLLVFDPQSEEIQAIDVQKLMESTMDNMGFLMLTGIVAILVFIWYMVLLYNGFKTASNAKGAKPVVLFILALLLAEILSKVLFFILY